MGISKNISLTFTKLVFFGILSLLALFVSAFAAPTVSSAGADTRPNIIIFLADDLGYADLGVYGSEIATPNLDALAEQGTRFSNYHTAATCSPTRSMLLTGVDNHLTGMGNMIEIMADNQWDQPGYEGYMTGDVVTVATLLKDSGYNTYMAGKWHLGKTKGQPAGRPGLRAFDRADGERSRQLGEKNLSADVRLRALLRGI
jgi:arylsulfatase